MKGDIRLSPKHGLNPSLGVCFWCGEDDGTILLLGMRGGYDLPAPPRCIAGYAPCPKCIENRKLGITLIEVDQGPTSKSGKLPPLNGPNAGINAVYPTGRWCVLKETAIAKAFQPAATVEDILRRRVAYVDSETADKLGLFKEDIG